jgi:hypothetical protein
MADRDCECDWFREVWSGMCGMAEETQIIIKVYIAKEFVLMKAGSLPDEGLETSGGFWN